jgi:thioredoxin reductase (NADPH)
MKTDVAIIGAGPIGIELAAALKRAGLDYLHFEQGQIGQVMYSLFPVQTRFFSSADRIGIAGVPLRTQDQSKATREEYLTYLRTVVETFDLEIRTYEPVVAVERRGGDFIVRTRKREYEARRVVLATGGTARPRMLDLPGEDSPHVNHHLMDPHMYFRKRVLVVGGRNSAVEAAIRCYNAGAQVAVSYRKQAFDPAHVKYWLLPEINGRIERKEMESHFSTRPVRISETEVTLERIDGSGTIEVPADFVLLMVGYVADMSLFRSAGAGLHGPQDAPTLNESTMETDVPGLYAAGTAVAGTQMGYRVFLENCHIHVDRILAALTGAPPPDPDPGPVLPES